MNHDFICYIIISTIKIPYRLKNNFRYNYTVILYNIIFRFSFQIRRSDEHTPRAVGVRKYIIFCRKFRVVVSSLSMYLCMSVCVCVCVCVRISCFCSFFPECRRSYARTPETSMTRGCNRVAILFSFFFPFCAFRSFAFPDKKEIITGESSSRMSRFLRASHAIPSFHFSFSLP